MRDINLTISDDDKWGGTREGSSTPNYLKDIMFELGAVDLGSPATTLHGLGGNGEK